MTAMILDFQGREFNTQRDLVLFIRECVAAGDPVTAQEFMKAYRETAPDTADNTMAVLMGWAFPKEPNRVKIAMKVFGVESNLFGGEAPGEALRPVWENAASLPEQIEQGIVQAEKLLEADPED